MKATVIEKLCVFLKKIHSDTQADVPTGNLPELAKEHDVPYYNNLASVLLKKDIIRRVGLGIYRWNVATEPNTEMAEAIYKILKSNQKKAATEEYPKLIRCREEDMAIFDELLPHTEYTSLENALLIGKDAYLKLKQVQSVLNTYLK